MEHLEHILEHKKFRKNSGEQQKFSGEVVSPFSFAHKFAHFHYINRGGGLSVALASAVYRYGVAVYRGGGVISGGA